MTRREATGYGLPRTTDHPGAEAAPLDAVAVVTVLDFTDPNAVWVKRTDGWRHRPGPRVVDVSIDPESGDLLTHRVTTGTLLSFDSALWRKTGNPNYSTWEQLDVTLLELDAQPSPTVTAADEVPGRYYTDLRPDSSSWRFDEGAWTEIGAATTGAALPWVSVADHGAVGDGITDDTAAFNAAVATLPDGGVLVVPPLTYRVTLPDTADHGAVTVTSGTTVLAHGATLVCDTTEEVAYRAIVGIGDAATPADHVHIEGLIIDGELATDDGDEFTMGVALYEGASEVRVTGCTFRDIRGDGVNAGEISSGADVHDVVIDHNEFVGLSGQAVVGNGGPDWLITDNYGHDSRNTGDAEAIIIVQPAATIVDNTFHEWGGIGASADRCIVEGNRVRPKTGTQTCVAVQGDHVSVRGNLLDCSQADATSGILIAAPTAGVTVDGNTIIRNGGDAAGIVSSVDGSTGLRVTANTIDGGQDEGTHQPDILLFGSTAGLVLTDNVCASLATAAMFVKDATDATITGNVCRYGAFIADTLTDATITGNRFNGANNEGYNAGDSGAGAYLLDLVGCVVTGNSVTANDDNIGLRLEGTSNRNLVSGNIIFADVLRHIQESNEGADDNVFAHNRLLGNGTGVLVSGAASVLIPFAGERSSLDGPLEHRYVRLVVTDFTLTKQPALKELAGLNGGTLVATYAGPAGIQPGGHGPETAIDGDLATFFQVNNGDPGVACPYSLTVDRGADRGAGITTIESTWYDGDYTPEAYEWQVSDDGAHWTTVKSVTGKAATHTDVLADMAVLSEALGLGKYVAVGFQNNPTWIDPAADDWADVVANDYGWVQFSFGIFTQVFAGNGANATAGFLVTATGASFSASGPNNAAVSAQASGDIGSLTITGETAQTNPLLDLQDVNGTSIFSVAPDGKVGAAAPSVGDVIKWDGTKWVADAP